MRLGRIVLISLRGWVLGSAMLCWAMASPEVSAREPKRGREQTKQPQKKSQNAKSGKRKQGAPAPTKPAAVSTPTAATASTQPPASTPAGKQPLRDVSRPGRAVTQYDRTHRISHLEAALNALRAADATVLDKAYSYVSALERGACASDNERLRVDCLITSSRRFCRGASSGQASRCALFMDVISSNVLSERELLSTAERYDIMRTHKDARAEMGRRLHRHYGDLAVQMRLSKAPGPSLGTDIDDFCQLNADRTSLSWQTCAAAIVWFVGRHP